MLRGAGRVMTGLAFAVCCITSAATQERNGRDAEGMASKAPNQTSAQRGDSGSTMPYAALASTAAPDPVSWLLAYIILGGACVAAGNRRRSQSPAARNEKQTNLRRVA